MRKEIIIVITFFMSAVTFSQEDKRIEVIYEIIAEDFTVEELAAIKDPNIRNKVVARSTILNGEQYILTGNRKKAHFKTIPKMNSDANKKSIFDSNTSEYYYDIERNKAYESTNLGGVDYNVFFPLDFLDWQITNETKEINGYLCYKALGVRKIDDIRGKSDRVVEAWFCPAVPYRYGPQMYFGLPGLIFEAFTQNAKNKYVVRSLKFTNESFNEILPKGKEISEKEAGMIALKIIENLTR